MNDNILRLKIPMNNIMRMQIINPNTHLVHNHRSFLNSQPLASPLLVSPLLLHDALVALTSLLPHLHQLVQAAVTRQLN